MSCRVKVVLRAKWKTAHFKKHLWENSSISNKAAPDENQCSQFSTPKICQWEPALLWVANVLIQTPKSIDPSNFPKLFSIYIYTQNIVNLQILLHFLFTCDFTTPNLLHLLGFRNDLAIHPSLGHDALDLLLRFSRVAIRNNKPFPYGTNSKLVFFVHLKHFWKDIPLQIAKTGGKHDGRLAKNNGKKTWRELWKL